MIHGRKFLLVACNSLSADASTNSATLQLEECNLHLPHAGDTLSSQMPGCASVLLHMEYGPREELCQQTLHRLLAGEVAVQSNPITADLEMKPKQNPTHSNNSKLVSSGDAQKLKAKSSAGVN